MTEPDARLIFRSRPMENRVPLGQRPPSLVASIPGPVSAGWVSRLARTECPALTARRARRQERAGAPNDPIVWTDARGSNVRDADGNVFVDLTAGFSVAAIGHAHPRVVAAVSAQAERLPHALGDVHPSIPKIELLERLAELAPFDARVILGLNGSDAIAAALKTAALATGKHGVLAFDGGYHGLMYGPLALCGYQPGFREPFAPQLNPAVVFAPYPSRSSGAVSLEAALAVVDARWSDELGAVVVEPALGRGGVVFPPDELLSALAERCRARGALLIVDEIFTGFGRTGARWASGSVVPDVLCVGKALGGGLPVSACIAKAEVMAAWGDPAGEAIHTATFAGNPLACAAALASLDVLDEDGLVARSRDVGEAWTRELEERLEGLACVREVRGRGLMIGVELTSGAITLSMVHALLTRGYLTLPAGRGAEVLALTPPLTIDPALLSGFTETLVSLLREVG